MNIIPNGMNQGASHPIQAAQQMQPMNHVMHGGQPIGMPMQNAMGGHPLHALGAGIHMQQPGVMGVQQPHMQILHNNQMVQVQAVPTNPQPVNEEVDPITKAKSMVPQLKDSLSAVHAEMVKTFLSFNSYNVEGNSQLDNTLQDFFSICNQIEANLKLVADNMQYNSESRKYFPFNVQEVPTPNQTTENVVQYHQYSNVIDTQVAYAQDIRDLLLNRGRKVKEQTPQPHPGTE